MVDTNTNTNTNTKLVLADISGRGWESDDTRRREGWSEDEMVVGRMRRVERDDMGRRGGWSENEMVGGRAARMTMESSDMRRREGWSENEMLERAGGRYTSCIHVSKSFFYDKVKGVFDFRSFLALFRLPAKCSKNHPIFLKFLQ